MQEVQIIITQISILTLLGLVGYIAGKTRYLPDNSGIVLSRVVIKLTAPLLIFTTLAGRDFTREILVNGIWIYVLGIIFLLLSLLFGQLTSKFSGLEESAANVFKMHFMFGNVIFLAFPLLFSLYNEEGLVYAVLFTIANDTLLWTLGIYLINKHKKTRWKDNLKHLINSNTIAFSSGLIIVLLKTFLGESINAIPYIQEVSGFVYSTFHSLGETTFPLSMLFIGLILSEMKIARISDLLKRYYIFILSAFKLIIIPVMALALLSVIGKSIDPVAKAVIVLQLAMPCGTIIPALAAQYESDYKLATENVFFTTILGIATMPLIVYLLWIFR